jgi:metal-dependent amidase/aminoacylase/carboxypeptidase family protein
VVLALALALRGLKVLRFQPTVLLHADMDALPVEEKTGLNYASKVKIKDDDGNTTPIAHACGHDMHVACLMAAAEWLSSTEVKEQWNGTLVVPFQSNVERGKDAIGMGDGGLYDKVPVPHVVLRQHVMPFRTGKVMAKAGTMIAA